MADTRKKDVNWSLPLDTAGNVLSWDAANLAVLMDLRDDLKEIRATLHNAIAYNGNLTRELRGLRRDVNARLKPRCHRAHGGK